MTFFKKKGVAWTVLVLCILAAVAIGIVRMPESQTSVPVPDSGLFVRYVDDAGRLLAGSTEKKVAEMNARWDARYRTHAAVVTTDDDVDVSDYAYDASGTMGLGDRDVILVLAANGDWYFACGYEVENSLTDYHYDRIGSAVQSNPDNDAAVEAFLRATDDFFADEMNSYAAHTAGSFDGTDGFLTKLIMLLVILFLLWVIIDAVRYRSYRRRYMVPGMGVPTRRYYPVFWGRRTMMPPRPPRRSPPPRPYNNRPSGGFGSPRTTRSSRPSGGFGGSRSSFGSRPSGGFGGSRSSRPSGGFGGSRGGGRSFGGGRGGRR